MAGQPGARLGKPKYLKELNLARDVKGIMKSFCMYMVIKGRLGKMWTFCRRKLETWLSRTLKG